jgi:hypothetical protein
MNKVLTVPAAVFVILVTALGILAGMARDRLAGRRIAVQKDYELAVQMKESQQRRNQELVSPEAIRQRAFAEGMVEPETGRKK